jgi:tubulin polyglutamylase TTLL1
VRWNKTPSAEAMGNFELLLDEELAAQDEAGHSNHGSARYRHESRGPAHRWK